jgi:hypothetical protein
LARHADGTSIEMADASHDATFGDHGNRTEPKLFSTHHRRDCYITSSTDTSICAEDHPVAKTIIQECRMSLRNTKLPRAASVLDRRKRRSASSAIITRDLDHISIRLGDTASNSSDTNGRNKLNGHTGIFVDGMKIMDQLRKILECKRK